jgi:tetratricopeptide (TPR) repeat protein
LDENNYFGRWLLASDAISKGEFDVAEAHLLVSLSSRSTPEALNDLAWVLYRLNRYDAAEDMANRALSTNPAMHSALGTLGIIALARGNNDRAVDLLAKAYDLSHKRAKTGLYYAEALLAQGDSSQAIDVIEEVSLMREELDMDDKKKLSTLRRSVSH